MDVKETQVSNASESEQAWIAPSFDRLPLSEAMSSSGTHLSSADTGFLYS